MDSLNRSKAPATPKCRSWAMWLGMAGALAWFLTAVPVLAQTDDGPFAAIFDSLPANNASRVGDLPARLSNLEADDIERLCRMLVEPGTGDDTKPRMALHALAMVAGDQGAEKLRGELAVAFGRLLESDATAPIKAFLIQQLQLAGSEDAVEPLSGLLGDVDLCRPASQALLAIGGDRARAALRAALPDAQGPSRVAIIDALGLLHDGDSVATLIQDAANDDKGIRMAALHALAAIGDRSATNTIGGGDLVFDWREHAELTDLRLRFLAGAQDEYYKEYAVAVLRSYMQLGGDDEFAHVHTAALHDLVTLQGGAAVDDVIAGLASESAEMRHEAVKVGTSLAGEVVTESLVGRMPLVPPAVRAGILTVLGLRGDPAALKVAREALGDEDQAIRRAAVTATARLAGADAIEPLVAFLDTAPIEEAELVQAELVKVSGAAVSERIAEAMTGAGAHVRVILLQALSGRRAADQLPAILAATTDANDKVCIAAINATGALADYTVAPRLLELLARTQSASEREALESALADVCNRADRPEQRNAPILAAMTGADSTLRASLIAILGKTGGPGAFNAIRQAMNTTDARLQEAAYQALTEWPDADVVEEILQIAEQATELKHHVLAMRGFARLVAAGGDRTADQMRAMYEMGMDAARRPEEKKLLLSRLSEIAEPETLTTLEKYLADDALKAEAASAMVNVADSLLPDGWAAARPAVEKVLAANPPENVRLRAETTLGHVGEYEDFITDWLVAGPFEQEGKQGHELLDIVFPPESPTPAAVEWRPQPPNDAPEQYWFVNLSDSVGGSHRVAYLRTRVHAATRRDVQLELGSDDGIKAWLNGTVIHTKNAPRGCRRGDDKVAAVLQQGWNDLLLKVSNDAGGWGACARFRTPEGARIPDVYAQTPQSP